MHACMHTYIPAADRCSSLSAQSLAVDVVAAAAAAAAAVQHAAY
jgi:hypothetical protein